MTLNSVWLCGAFMFLLYISWRMVVHFSVAFIGCVLLYSIDSELKHLSFPYSISLGCWHTNYKQILKILWFRTDYWWPSAVDFKASCECIHKIRMDARISHIFTLTKLGQHIRNLGFRGGALEAHGVCTISHANTMQKLNPSLEVRSLLQCRFVLESH